MSQLISTWDKTVQPPDEKWEVICFYESKYEFLQRGLELLLERVCEVNEKAKKHGLSVSILEDDENYVRRMVGWGQEKLAGQPGLVEERSTIRSIRYLKAGILLLILKERAAAPTGLPICLLDEWNKKIDNLESLAEEKQLEGLKPADIFCRLAELSG